jgi:hypothetical protein
MIYNAGEITGKTLFAKLPVQLKREPADAAPSVFTVPPGQAVGTVFSYISPKIGRNKNLYWQFLDDGNRYFYAEQKPGLFDLEKLAIQGAQSLEEIAAEKEESEKDWFTKIKEFIFPIIGLGALVYFVKK